MVFREIRGPPMNSPVERSVAFFIILLLATPAFGTPRPAERRPKPQNTVGQPSEPEEVFFGLLHSLESRKPSAAFSAYRRRIEARGTAYVALPPVERVLGDWDSYKGRRVAFSIPIREVAEQGLFSDLGIAELPSGRGVQLTWQIPSLGRYSFVCPIRALTKDVFPSGDINERLRSEFLRLGSSRNYLHVQGTFSTRRTAVNRDGVTFQIPVVLVDAVDDGYRFVAVGERQAKQILGTSGEVAESKAAALASDARQSLVMAIKNISKDFRAVIISYNLTRPQVAISLPYAVWTGASNRLALLRSFVEQVKAELARAGVGYPASVELTSEVEYFTSSPCQSARWTPNGILYRQWTGGGGIYEIDQHEWESPWRIEQIPRDGSWEKGHRRFDPDLEGWEEVLWVSQSSSSYPGRPNDSGRLSGSTDASEPLRVGGDVLAPVLINRVEPSYPEAVRKARLEGVVKVEAVVTATGSVEEVKVVNSSSPPLDASAVRAVQQWKYKPATLNGQPVAVYLTVTVTFNLH